jgi:hypothetical protein
MGMSFCHESHHHVSEYNKTGFFSFLHNGFATHRRTISHSPAKDNGIAFKFGFISGKWCQSLSHSLIFVYGGVFYHKILRQEPKVALT